MKDKNTKNLRKSMNRGSVEHESKVAENEGEIMTLAKKEVICIPQTKSIKEAAEMMIEHGFRRLPVTHPGSNKLLGIVTAMDILDFLGGGSKFDIIEKKHNDNFLAAINDPVKEIMTRDPISIGPKYSIRESVDVMTENGIGSVPIVDKEEKVVGIVTERDFALALAGSLTDETVGDIMIKDVITTTPGTPIESCSKIMVRNNLDITRVKGHHMFSAKDCPQPMLEEEMQIWWEFIELVRYEKALLTTLKDAAFKLTVDEDCASFVGENGRIESQPEFAKVIEYTVEVTVGDKVETITLASSVNGIYSK